MTFTGLPDELRTSLETTDEQSEGGSDDNKPGDDTKGDTKTNDGGDDKKAGTESKGDDDGDTKGVKTGEPPKPFTFDGKEYNQEALEGIIREHQNNENWNKTNTENAQANKATAKAMDKVLEVVEKIASDEDAVEVLQDYGYNLSKEDIQQVRKAAAEAKPAKPKEDTGAQAATGDEIGKLKERIDQVETERQFERDLQTFATKDDDHRKAFDTPEKVDGFLKFMVDNGIPDMDKAYGLYTAEQRAEAAEKELNEVKGGERSPNAPLGKGPREIKSDFKPVTGDFGYDAAGEATRKTLGI